MQRMRRPHRAFPALLFIASALLAPGQAHAQSTHRRGGVYFGLGAGIGAHRLVCSGCDATPVLGGGGTITIGGTLSPRVVLGGELAAGLHGDDHYAQGYAQLGPVLLFYPRASRGFFLKTGVSVAGVGVAEGGEGAAAIGGAAVLGVGCDLPIASRGSVAATPSLTWRQSIFAGGGSGLLQAGLAVTLP